MNGTQIQSTLAPLVSFLAGLLAAKIPWLDTGAWTQILGALMGVGATIWAAVATKKTSLITTVANDPDVQSVKLQQFASASVVDATPNNVTK